MSETGTAGGVRGASPPSKKEDADNGGGMECPECGILLADQDHRTKHAIYHYGDDLIPPYPDHNLAAERKGALLGVDPQTLRGFPNRRW